MWGRSDSSGIKKWGWLGWETLLKHFVVVSLGILLLVVDGKEYETEDSVVLEGDPPPRLPGPSIFDYKNDAMFPLSSQASNTVSTLEGDDSDSAKVKREPGEVNGKVKGQEDKANSASSQPHPPNHPRYYEMAGNQLYVFEPSPMGAGPFVDSFVSQSQDIENLPLESERPSPRQEHHHHFALPGPHPFPGSRPPHVVVKVSSHPAFNFDSVKIERVTPRDAVISSSGRGGHRGHGSMSSDSSPGDWDQGENPDMESSTQDDDRDDGERTHNSETMGGGGDDECVSANEKEGQCVPFDRCYPVVFNSVTGELRNHGLARMLYQASGPCGKANDSWTVQTVTVQVQPGLLSNVPLEIPPDFFNHTVCCPGYFYFEENTIPHHFPPFKGHQGQGQRQRQHSDKRDNIQNNKPPPLKLKLKPSHPDPMLSPQEGRSFPPPGGQPHFDLQPHPHHRQHNPHHPLHIQMSHPPPPILLHPHEMFDSDLMLDSYQDPDSDYNNNNNNNNNFYFDESDDDFDSSYYTTARPTTTTTSTSSTVSSTTKRPRLRQRVKAPKGQDVDDLSENVIKSGEDAKNDTRVDEGADGSTRSEVKVDAGDKGGVKGGGKRSNSTSATTPTPSKGTDGGSKPIKKRRPGSGGNKTGNRTKPVPKSEAAVPVIVSPPHLSAWNCPGRSMVSPRGQWSWMVALLNEGSHFCSGSLIDHRSILTSASCVASFQGKDMGKIRAILGDRILYSSVDGPHLWRKIVRITRHILYSPESMEHDIAILEMESGVTFTPTIQPINLPSSSNKGHTNKAIVSGWSGADLGKRFFSARPTVDSVVEFMEGDECFKRYHGFSIAEKAPEGVICTKPNSTTCKADLGAPLMMKTGNCWHIIGILSHGLGCGTFPDVYTDISKYLPWIQKNIRPHFKIAETFLKT